MPFDPSSFDDKVVDLLISAKDRINQGWIKGHLTYEGRLFCALGSLRKDDLSDEQYDAVALLYSCLPLRFRLFPTRYIDLTRAEGAIVTFNDSSRIRKKDVLALYDRAIAKARESVS
jgi:hypothetical protein